MDHVGKTFADGAVHLDGDSFERCTFRNVVFHYGGGPAAINDCRFEGGMEWKFEGDLERGLGLLGSLFSERPELAMKIVQNAMFGRVQ